MFLQIHFLTSYHASLLNRDDAGLAKRIRFGGAERLRVSSQCQKRHWREWMMPRTPLPGGVRSRHFFSRIVKRELVEGGVDEALAHELVLALAKSLLTAAGDKDAVDPKTLEMKQPVLFGRPEADYFLALLREAAAEGDAKAGRKRIESTVKEGRKNFRALLAQAGLSDPAAGFDGALFGRFVTSDILSRVDAPVHVAHAFTVHALDTEVDFFTVVDDLARDEETGAAHANDMELGAGLFYGYVAVDVPLLVSNLTGCKREEWRDQDSQAARELLGLLVRAIAEVSPGAKLGSTAPHARAAWLMLEAGESQPRSLANAFLQPVRLDGESHPVDRALQALASHLDELEAMYGDTGERRAVASTRAWPRDDVPVRPLDGAISGALDHVFGSAP